jgi:putative transposase
MQFLGSARGRDVFLKILEEVRGKFDFAVCGYVVMPEHFHLLITEPRVRLPTSNRFSPASYDIY